MLHLKWVEKEQLFIQVAQYKRLALASITISVRIGVLMHQARTRLLMSRDQTTILIMITFGMSGLG